MEYLALPKAVGTDGGAVAIRRAFATGALTDRSSFFSIACARVVLIHPSTI